MLIVLSLKVKAERLLNVSASKEYI
jgi:hypothetical protein